MLDFTSEHLLNDLSRVQAVTNQGVANVRIHGSIVLSPTNLKTFYKRAGNAPVLEVATITLAAPVVGVFRLGIDIRLSGSQNSDYNRYAINKGKPLFVETNVTVAHATTTLLAAALVAPLNKGLTKSGFKDVVVSANAGTLVITSTNEYQRLISVKLDSIGSTGIEAVAGTSVITTVGKEGFGTAWYLTKNFRIPTGEATRFMGENQDERPKDGVIYNQYTFGVEVDRGTLHGMGAVGQKMVSATTHVVFVPSTLSAAFEALILTGTTKAPVTV